MNLQRAVFAIGLAIGIGACGYRSDRAVSDSSAKDPSSPAYKAGEAAHKIAKETEKIAKKAGEKLKQGAREASAGWKKSAQEDKEKRREQP